MAEVLLQPYRLAFCYVYWETEWQGCMYTATLTTLSAGMGQEWIQDGCPKGCV